MKSSLFTVLAVSSLVALGACGGADNAAEDAAMDTTVAPPPAPMPMDSMTVDTTVVIDTTKTDTTP